MELTFGDAETLRTAWNGVVRMSNTGFGLFDKDAERVNECFVALSLAIAEQEKVGLAELDKLPHETKLTGHACRRFLLYLAAIVAMDDWNGVDVVCAAFSEGR